LDTDFIALETNISSQLRLLFNYNIPKVKQSDGTRVYQLGTIKSVINIL